MTRKREGRQSAAPFCFRRGAFRSIRNERTTVRTTYVRAIDTKCFCCYVADGRFRCPIAFLTDIGLRPFGYGRGQATIDATLAKEEGEKELCLPSRRIFFRRNFVRPNFAISAGETSVSRLRCVRIWELAPCVLTALSKEQVE